MKTLRLLSGSGILLLLIVMVSCNDAKQNTEVGSATTEVEQESEAVVESTAVSTNLLCKINGKDWEYTEASGIISNERKWGRIAFITFKKKLDKGSESIQLRYDDDTKELISALVQLKFPKKGGGLLSCTYQHHFETDANKPETKIAGKIDVSDPSEASGNAEITDLPIRFEKNSLENLNDGIISITGLNFSGVGYSDLDKEFGN